MLDVILMYYLSNIDMTFEGETLTLAQIYILTLYPSIHIYWTYKTFPKPNMEFENENKHFQGLSE